MSFPAELDGLRILFSHAYEIGSRVTCDPPVMDTDQDILIVTGDKVAFAQHATDAGFEITGSVPADALDGTRCSQFISMRLGIINLIVTDDTDFARRFLAATSVAKRFNLLKKDDRIALFQAVLYGNPCEYL